MFPPSPPLLPVSVTRTRHCTRGCLGSSGGWSVWSSCWDSCRTAACQGSSSWGFCRYWSLHPPRSPYCAWIKGRPEWAPVASRAGGKVLEVGSGSLTWVPCVSGADFLGRGGRGGAGSGRVGHDSAGGGAASGGARGGAGPQAGAAAAVGCSVGGSTTHTAAPRAPPGDTRAYTHTHTPLTSIDWAPSTVEQCRSEQHQNSSTSTQTGGNQTMLTHA